jgi:hypothetical protein
VLSIDFDESTKGYVSDQLNVFFDTGARHNYISDGLMKQLGMPIEYRYFRSLERDVGPAVGKDSIDERMVLKSLYVEQTLQVTVSDGGRSFSGESQFRIVVNWAQSTFASVCKFGECHDSSEIATRMGWYRCGHRQGLLSAGLLHDLELTAILDGSKRTLALTRTEE